MEFSLLNWHFHFASPIPFTYLFSLYQLEVQDKGLYIALGFYVVCFISFNQFCLLLIMLVVKVENETILSETFTVWVSKRHTQNVNEHVLFRTIHINESLHTSCVNTSVTSTKMQQFNSENRQMQNENSFSIDSFTIVKKFIPYLWNWLSPPVENYSQLSKHSHSICMKIYIKMFLHAEW